MRFASDLILAIAGPTGSGKSALALDLARHLRSFGQKSELICCDSITVYRGFNVGSAKPTNAERSEFTHHLLDLRDPTESFTAAEFAKEADAAIAAIRERDALPILVGGTGFYLRALLQGMTEETPEETDRARELKESLSARADSGGLSTLHQEMLTLDPGLQGKIHPNDRYRIIRALQVMHATGKRWSELNDDAKAREPRYKNVRLFWIDLDREELRSRVLTRTEAMLRDGLLAEVQGLLDRGVPLDAKPLQSVGYKEALVHLMRPAPLDLLRNEITQETMRLAKAQRTWFRGEPLAERLDPPTVEELLRRLNLS